MILGVPLFLETPIYIYISHIKIFPISWNIFFPDSEVWGHDIDRSNEKVRLKELERLKAIGAIGSLTAR